MEAERQEILEEEHDTIQENHVFAIALPPGFYYNEYQSSLPGFIANLYGRRR